MPAPWRAAFPRARVVPDDPVLDLAPGTLDLVIHAMALHWADDPVGQIVQSARALRPDGSEVVAGVRNGLTSDGAAMGTDLAEELLSRAGPGFLIA